MKIAFVSQPIDTIVPPFQNSVGACTYGAAAELAKWSEVVVYGLRDQHSKGDEDAARSAGVDLRLVDSSYRDRCYRETRRVYSRLVQTGPQSTASGFYSGYGREIAKALKAFHPEVVHVQHFSQYVPAIREANPSAKIVLHLHSEWFSQSNFERLRNRIQHLDLVTAVSNYITAKTKRDFPEVAGRCETTYNGFSSTEFGRSKDWKRLRSRTTKRILYSGALSPHKGVHVLIEAFLKVLNHYPDVRLDLVGLPASYPLEETFDLRNRESYESIERFYANSRLSFLLSKLRGARGGADDYQSYLREMVPASAADRITFHGFVPRPTLVDLYYDADIFAFPPVWNEGFGLPPVEAMAAATPVVVSRSGALPETVEDGQTGILVEKNDASALAEALLRLLRDGELAQELGSAGRKRMMHRFTWMAVAKEMNSRYERLAGLATGLKEESGAQSVCQ